MPSLGWQELVLILLIVIIIFGAGKLPEIGGAVGRGIREFRQATKDDEPEPLDAHASVDPARVNEPARTSEPVHKDV